jgi:hypothetical protein
MLYTCFGGRITSSKTSTQSLPLKFKEICSVFYDMPVSNMRAQAPDSDLVSGGTEGVNPRHVVRNVFLLKLVTLRRTPEIHLALV